MQRLHRLILLLFLLAPFGLFASPVFPPATNLLVNDFAGVFTSAQTQTMEARLEAFSDSTSNQICVVTVSDLQGYDAGDFAQRLGQAWGVGSSKDNGVLILVKPRSEAERYIDVFIATGYGIEGALPDALCKRIINNQMAPFLRQDPPDYYSAVEAAVSQIEPIMLGEYNEGTDEDDDAFVEALIVFIFIVIIMLFLFGSRGRGHRGGWSAGSSWGASSGSWGRSSGGFSGGGSSFGGFGGGSFGGGGAGGRF